MTASMDPQFRIAAALERIAVALEAQAERPPDRAIPRPEPRQVGRPLCQVHNPLGPENCWLHAHDDGLHSWQYKAGEQIRTRTLDELEAAGLRYCEECQAWQPKEHEYHGADDAAAYPGLAKTTEEHDHDDPLQGYDDLAAEEAWENR